MVLRRTKWMKAKLHLVVVCVIKHIQLSQFRHTLNYSLKWILRSFWALNLNNRPWFTLHVLGNEDREKCNTRTTMWGETYKCQGKIKLEGLIQRKEDKIHLKLDTIKSVKACNAFLFSNKIIRVSYCAIAYTHLCSSFHLAAMIPFVFLPLFSLLRSFIT